MPLRADTPPLRCLRSYITIIADVAAAFSRMICRGASTTLRELSDSAMPRYALRRAARKDIYIIFDTLYYGIEASRFVFRHYTVDCRRHFTITIIATPRLMPPLRCRLIFMPPLRHVRFISLF